MDISIKHNAKDQAFYASYEGQEAELAYARPTDSVIDFTHTFVDEELRGRGVGEAMAKEALQYARQHHLRVRTSCEFMADYVGKNRAEYQDILDHEPRPS
ncbi:GNAT family N-acetyltransferase [Hymenobacter jejuensis]|uniref:N-acetyltransferase n=1 Tax=Hymenobacter jejuensis TaxID=2502781 RepID=A0A5B7ZWQ7_9BACT|nr:GNAT family N-acetyltransferase [Hymenobacter jejuensis]QDA59045.1 N-acetyltransferase [Hymenobacter jejuensis]